MNWRLGALGVVFAGLLGVLTLRLWTIQVTQVEAYEQRAARNQVRIVPTPAPRGDIFDAKGRLLAGTRSSLAVVVDTALLPEEAIDDVARRLAAILDLPVSEVVDRLEGAARGTQVVIGDDLDDRQALAVAEFREELPGVALLPEPIRTYPMETVAAHVLGYIGRPNDEDLQRPGVKGTDFVGKAGVERTYDDLLRGTEGLVKYRVDAAGNVLGRIGERPPEPGRSLLLTVDADVQMQLEASLADGLRLARRLEMEERAAALARRPVAQRLAEAEAEARAEAAEAARQAAAGGADGASPPAVPGEPLLDRAEVLGPVYEGLPVDADGVCVPVERHTLRVGDTVVLSGRVPRRLTLERIEEDAEGFVASVLLEDERIDVRPRQRFGGTLRAVALEDDVLVVHHEDRWCPVRAVGVVLDPGDGSVVAMSSSPGFSPAAFVDGLTDDEWERLAASSAFTNFAVQGLYAPASTFKAVAYMLAMEEGVYPLDRRPEEAGTDRRDEDEQDPAPLVSDTDLYNCGGEFVFRLADGTVERRRDWKWPGTHGPLDLHGALEESCDLYFWDIALRIWNERNDVDGINDENLVQEWARRFGFGELTGIDLPFERRGLVPDRAWFSEEQRQGSPRVRPEGPWSGGDLMNLIVGQGAMLVTPLQLANAFAAMVNGGVVYQPRVVAQILDADGEVVDERPPRVLQRIELDPRTVASFREDLGRVVNGENGTARAAFTGFGPGVDLVGGKTGTGEVIKAPRSRHEFQVDNGLFVGVAPIDDPRWVVAVVVERGGSGGKVAAPIARQVLQFLLNGPDGVTELAPGLDAD